MSRMFNVLNSASSPRSDAATVTPRPAPRLEAEETAREDDVPFVEIGAPSGPVFSSSLKVLKLPEPVKAADAVAAPAVAERTFPRLATPKYLSVTFHDLTGRKRNEIERDGPDAGLVALHLPDHPISGEYRTLRDEIRMQLPDPTPRVLWFNSAANEAGTTSVLLNLAITIARENSPRVLAVDANVERPAIADRFALPKTVPGLAEVLAQQIPLAWAVQATTLPNFQVLPAGTHTPATAEHVTQDLPKLISQLRQWYDWVLIDSGMWGSMPQRDAICTTADAVYLVSRETDVERTEFLGVRGWVKELGGLLRGYIATKV